MVLFIEDNMGKISIHKLCFIYILLLTTGCATVVDSVTSSPISSDTKKRSLGAWIDDQAIETMVEVNIKKADQFLRQSRVKAVSFNGMVLLVGQVMNEKLKDIAGVTAQELDRVNKVYNQIEIKPNITLKQQSNDSWITTKVKSMLLKNKEIGSTKIKVITEDATVYLLGLVTRVEANRAIAIAREITGVRKVINLLEYR
jgi:osmotically-inducible protein OsmY